MARTMKCLPALCVAASLGWAATAAAQTPVATWSFNNTLAANEGGVPALVAIDPLGLNGFVTDTVFGVTQTVYKFDGNSSPPNQQAGLYVDTASTGLLNGDDAYSVDMVFKFDADNFSWKNIFSVSNRTSDNAFYVSPQNFLQVWPDGNGLKPFTFGEYHHITLTNDGANQVTSYFDGVFQFNLTSSSMNFSDYVGGNPGRLMHFFADNLTGGGLNEFTDGSVAQIKLYDIVLSASEVGQIAAPVPEPETYAMMLAGLGLMAVAVRRRRQAASS